MKITIELPDEFVDSCREAHERRMDRLSVADRVPWDFGDGVVFCTKFVIGALNGIREQDAEEQVRADFEMAKKDRGAAVESIVADALGAAVKR